MKREQFTFFRSWLSGIELIKKKSERCDAYEAIINYALDGVEADVSQLPVTAAVAYVFARPIIDSGRKKSEAGRNGGEKTPEAKRKQTGSKPEAKSKQSGSKPEAKSKQLEEEVEEEEEEEKEDEVELEEEEEAEGKRTLPPTSPAARAYMDKITAVPSTVSMRELLEFEKALGSDVCLRAIDEALDANVRSWKYIRAILQDKKDRGITSLEAWDQMEAQRQDSRARRQKADAAPEAFDSGDIDWMFEDRKEDGNGPDHTG